MITVTLILAVIAAETILQYQKAIRTKRLARVERIAKRIDCSRGTKVNTLNEN